MAPRIFYPRKRRRAFRMRSIPRKSETLGNRPWRMGWPPAKAQERGGAAAGGRSPPARCRAEPGSGPVRGPGPWPSNAAAAPRPKGSALAAGNGRPWAIRRSRRGRGRAGTEIRGGGGVWRPGGAALRGRPPASQTKERGPGPKAPGQALSGRFAPRRRPPSAAEVSTNAKKATQKPGPTIYGAWRTKPW